MEACSLKSWGPPAAGKNVPFQEGLQNIDLLPFKLILVICTRTRDLLEAWAATRQTHNKRPQSRLPLASLSCANANKEISFSRRRVRRERSGADRQG